MKNCFLPQRIQFQLLHLQLQQEINVSWKFLRPVLIKKCTQSEIYKTNFNDVLCKFIVLKYLPYSFFEDSVITELCSAIQRMDKEMSIPSQKVLREHIQKKFEEHKQLIKTLLLSNSSKISLTLDSWSSIANESYCAITCHFIDQDWKLNSFVLDFVPLQGQHSGEELANIVFKIFKFYEIENKIQGITTDNAASMFTFANCLEDLMGNSFDSNNNHFTCFAHILNLAVQDFMKLLKADNTQSDLLYSDSDDKDSEDESDQSQLFCESPVNKVRSLLKKIKKSEQLQLKFNNYCDTFQLSHSRPIIDVKTRWNSTYDMLNWSFKYKLPINVFCDANISFKTIKPSNVEWNLIERVLNYLKPFKTLSNLFSGEKFCTISMVVLGINILLDKLEKWAFQCDSSISRTKTDELIIFALNAARDKILKHYRKTNWMYWILDPRHKIEAFKMSAWGKELEKTSAQKFEDILKNVYFIPTEINEQQNKASSSDSDEFDISLSQIFLKNEKSDSLNILSGSENCKSEIRNYLSVQRVDEGTDILEWWKFHEKSFPTIAKMAKDFFSIMSSSVSSEGTFSKASLILRKHRNRLNASSMRNLVCLNSWIKLNTP